MVNQLRKEKRTEDKLTSGMSIDGICRYLRTGVLLSRVILFGRFLSARIRSHLISGNELGLGGRHHKIMNLTRSSAAGELTIAVRLISIYFSRDHLTQNATIQSVIVTRVIINVGRRHSSSL